MMSLGRYVVVILLAVLVGVFGLPNKVILPDYNGPSLDMYSGYVTVDEANQRALFYWLFKAESSPDTKPLLVWFQGGPGCSGLIGLFLENGPLHVHEGTTPGSARVVYNPLGWTKFANVLFIEQPAFVGFSYSNTSSDVNTGDDKAAHDNKKFLELFVTSEFKEFLGRETWFTGESYGGVYVPTVTDLILADKGGVLYPQLKGFMIGNPVFSCQSGFIGESGYYLIEEVNLLYWHGLASYTNYANWTAQGCNDPITAQDPKCTWIHQNVITQVGVISQEKRSLSFTKNQAPPPPPPVTAWPSLDPDDIFQDFCTGNGTLEFANTPDATATCPQELGDLLTTYLNRADVQAALTVNGITWAECSSKIRYSVSGKSMVPLYENFFVNKPGFSILVYSGDLDILTVPFAFTQPCIAKLSGKLVADWQPWFVNGATAGYVEKFDKYTYATIKGAGHEAPLYQPLISFQMIQRFIQNGVLTSEEETLQAMQMYKRISMRRRQGDILRRMGVSP